jgi:hypothetical protein
MTDFSEAARAAAAMDAVVFRRGGINEHAEAHGVYTFECRGPDGELKWRDTIDNVVCTEGKNLAFDTFIAGSSYTATGPYLGLISSVSWVQVAATDTGVQINGTNQWKEAGGGNAPTYTGNRPTTSGGWNAASGGAKALTTAITFSITGTGTIEGGFILYGSGALATKDDAHGVLWSAGTFSGGVKTVGSGDTVSVSYSTSM